jgi:hypothetical protein
MDLMTHTDCTQDPMLNVNGRSVYIEYRLTVYIYIHKVVNQKIQMKATVSITSGRKEKKATAQTSPVEGEGRK